MADNNGGPWGGANPPPNKPNGANTPRPKGAPDKKPSSQPEIEDLVKLGQDKLRVLMGGKNNGKMNGGGDSDLPPMRLFFIIGAIGAMAFWAYMSFYSVRPEQKSVELLFGQFHEIGEPGLNFAPWPVVKAEVVDVSTERKESIGTGKSGSDAGLMLTGDENVVDIDFQVVWNITDPAKFLFNLADPETTIEAVSESAMREIIAQSELAPILNRDRGVIAQRLDELVQATLNNYDAGVNIVRVTFDRADPPQQVIDAFRDVQAAEQERDQLRNQADAYANRVLAGARGESEQILQQAEGYRAQVVNEAQGEASRFLAILKEYQNAPDVTRKRLYLETMEKVLGRVDKIILDTPQNGNSGQGVVPYLPLNELLRKPTPKGLNQ